MLKISIADRTHILSVSLGKTARTISTPFTPFHKRRNGMEKTYRKRKEEKKKKRRGGERTVEKRRGREPASRLQS